MVYRHWLTSIIQADATHWVNQNKNDETNSTFKIKRNTAQWTETLTVHEDDEAYLTTLLLTHATQC
jgi:hypothetical protein